MIRIKELRQKRNITQNKLAEQLKLSRSTIAMYETGASEPDFNTALEIAKYFDVSVDYLIGNDFSSDENNKKYTKIPVYGKIPAGIPTEMIDESYIENFEEINSDLLRGGNTYFGLKVTGNSMFPEFRDGDTLILKKQDSCESGEYCAISINHTECTFKKVVKHTNGITLQPLNPDYSPAFYSLQDISELPITILGVVKEVRRSY